MTADNTEDSINLALEQAITFARANIYWNRVYTYISSNLQDFFRIDFPRRYSIAHQIVHHGNVNEFERFLTLFINQHINIKTPTRDNKTFLDIAAENRKKNPDMYNYVERLFMQDNLLQSAKEGDWREVTDILNINPWIANEKPPYSSNFLLHYVIQHGNTNILEELINAHGCSTDVMNNEKETPLVMAKRLGKHDMCSILDGTVVGESSDITKSIRSSANSNSSELDKALVKETIKASNKETISSKKEMNNTISSSSDTKNMHHSVSSVSVVASEKVVSIVPIDETSSKENSAVGESSLTDLSIETSRTPIKNEVQPLQISQSDFKKSETQDESVQHTCIKDPSSPTDTITNYLPASTSEEKTMAPPASNLSSSNNKNSVPAQSTIEKQCIDAISQLHLMTIPPPVSNKVEDPQSSVTISNLASASGTPSMEIRRNLLQLLRCPISNKVLVNPVIGDDGQTYEEDNIVEWVGIFHTSPVTGAPMGERFRENVNVKLLVEQLPISESI